MKHKNRGQLLLLQITSLGDKKIESGNGMSQGKCHCNALYVMFCTIWDHFYNLKTVKNTHGGVVLL